MFNTMKNHNLLIVCLIALLTSCVGGQLNPTYVYNTNPAYTWGYAEYFGAYYSDYSNKNNVISLSLFSDSLKINNIGNLTGTGQYLFLEDVFISPTDSVIQVGTYTVSNSGLPFTVAPGLKDTVDNQVFLIGASISYYEGNPDMSVQKLITDGSFTVSKSGKLYHISCNLKTADKKDLKGSFTALLPHTNQSVNTPKNTPRKQLNYVGK